MLRAAACIALVLQATFSVHTELVVLPVTVTDGRGHRITGLTADNFQVYDDGKINPIVLFQTGEVPITIGLVVDHSQSMSTKLAAVNNAASAFARMAHDNDELFIVMFSTVVRRPIFNGNHLFTSDPAVLDEALAARIPGGPTALYDAVGEGLRNLPLGTSPRKALIVVTDGGDNASRMKYREIRDLARQSNAAVYGIGLVGANSQDENPDLLKRLCSDTGGLTYFPGPADDVKTVFEEIARDLHEQYTLSIATDAPIRGRLTHELRITATGPDGKKLQVRSRTAYDTKPLK